MILELLDGITVAAAHVWRPCASGPLGVLRKQGASAYLERHVGALCMGFGWEMNRRK